MAGQSYSTLYVTCTLVFWPVCPLNSPAANLAAAINVAVNARILQSKLLVIIAAKYPMHLNC